MERDGDGGAALKQNVVDDNRVGKRRRRPTAVETAAVNGVQRRSARRLEKTRPHLKNAKVSLNYPLDFYFLD
jgi:hypothetical protein